MIEGKCGNYNSDQVARFLAGSMSPRQQRRFEQHLADCPDCRRKLAEFEAIQALLKQAPAPLPPRNFTLPPEAAHARRPFLWYPVLRSATTALAAIVLVIFMASLILPQQGGAPPSHAVNAKPTSLVAPSLPPVAVEPAETWRELPTVAGRPNVLHPTLTSLPTVTPLTAYPADVSPTSWIQATVSRVATTPASSSPPVGGGTTGPAIRAAALALLGLFLGLTWVSYRRERAFFF